MMSNGAVIERRETKYVIVQRKMFAGVLPAVLSKYRRMTSVRCQPSNGGG